MSNTEELKNYLIDEADGFLLNDDNNGKTIMLSGVWGAGKTHFWQNAIELILKTKQTAIYVSLYGKESIDEIKFDIFKEAYNSQVKDDFISKSASFFSTITPSLGEKSLTDGFEKLNKESKDKKAMEILQEGSVICLDDFERKSKKVDLNDLFGFISQLAIDMNCKMVIILNSDVFEGEEKNVFKNVKEKTVNKFFYFEPTPKELFYSVAKNQKYDKLDEYKEQILNTIEETEKLNARIYIQVLDNCLEWIDKGYEKSAIRALIVVSIAYINSHILLKRATNNSSSTISYSRGYLMYDLMEKYPREIFRYFYHNFTDFESDHALEESIGYYTNSDDIVDLLIKYIGRKNKDKSFVNSSSIQDENIKWVNSEMGELRALWKYGYKLNAVRNLDDTMNYKLVKFVKTGILPKQTKEVETSVPPEAIAETEE